MVPYFPHTEDDIKGMLKEIGVKKLDELFDDIPSTVRLEEELSIPKGKAEYEVLKKAKEYAGRNNVEAVSFLGCGSYDHLIPSTVKPIISRSEFYTAYTPYQAEISQGILQSIFEFQTMICQITGLDVSNASLYDGHTAAVEAAVMALNIAAKEANTILYSAAIHPFTKKVLATHFGNTPAVLKEIPQKDGVTDRAALLKLLGPDVAGVICQTPNVYGFTEDLSGFAEAVHEAEALFIVSSNPASLGLFKSQGEWGADIAIGDAQPLGLPSYFGGPSVGYISAKEALLRKLPGRIVGQSLDAEGKRAFLLTLQAREQHIKRQRATSNICSNQALCALAVGVFLSTLGEEGFREFSALNYRKAHYLFKNLTEKLKLSPLSRGEFFNEFTLKLPKKAGEVVKGMADRGFFAGVPLADIDPKADPSLLVIAVTEKRTQEEMDSYVDALREVLK